VSAYVLDTHPLVFYAGNNLSKLSKAVRAIFERFEDGDVCLYVPTPVVIETWQLSLNGTIRLQTTLEGWWSQIQRPELAHVDLTLDDVLRASSLEWEHQDPFDRLIVATALRLDCSLITKDVAITDWGGVDVTW
jgi:PIN domain nuclease of toxin-antitoxin system